MNNVVASGPSERAIGRVASVANNVGDRRGVISRLIEENILRDIIELRNDPKLVQLLGGSIEGNVETLVHMLRFGIDSVNREVPTAAMEYARRLAQHGVHVDALVRAYRLGQTEFLRIMFDEVRATETDAQTGMLVIQRIMVMTADYIDWATRQVVAVYSAERERWLSHRASVRAVRVRGLLSQRQVDAVNAGHGIDFPMRQRHIALIAWIGDEGNGASLTYLEHELRRFRDLIHLTGDPLLVPADRAMMWVWLPLANQTSARHVVDAARVLALKPEHRIFFSVGTVESGLHGFRISHMRAARTRSVMLLAPNGRSVCAFEDPGLSVTAILSGEADVARDYVQYVLGPLAGDDAHAGRLRETLSVFLSERTSYKTAADRLHVHPNTIKYRVQKAEAQRGRPILDDRIEVEVALMLCAQLGAAVLTKSNHAGVGAIEH